jgi:hypothetical protein
VLTSGEVGKLAAAARWRKAGVAQVVEHSLRKAEVHGSTPRAGSICPHGREYRHCTLAVCKEAIL